MRNDTQVFPVVGPLDQIHSPGMTLREYYVGQALRSGLLPVPVHVQERTDAEWCKHYAEAAVMLADAVIAALKEVPDENA